MQQVYNVAVHLKQIDVKKFLLIFEEKGNANSTTYNKQHVW